MSAPPPPYEPPKGYPPAQQGHPPPQQGYPPPQQGYPPPQQGYPPPQQGYPPPQPGYQQPQPGYQQPQPGYQQPGYAPVPTQGPPGVVVVQQQQPTVQHTIVTTQVHQRPRVNHLLHFLISLFFWPWLIVWLILCIAE